MGIIKKIFIIGFVIVCLFGIWGTFFPGNNSQEKAATPTQNDEWKTYTNKQYHYSVTYPGAFILSEETPHTTIFQKEKSQFGKVSFPTLYVSVIPKSYAGKENDIYHFMPTRMIDQFFLMKEGESQLIEPEADPTYWTYTKLATIPVAGDTAIVIQNDRVWEADEGTHNRRIILRDTKGMTYIIGSYYQTQEELTTLQRFVERFKHTSN